MSVLRRMMRVSNRFLLVFIFIFSLSSSCLYFIYVAPGIANTYLFMVQARGIMLRENVKTIGYMIRLYTNKNATLNGTDYPEGNNSSDYLVQTTTYLPENFTYSPYLPCPEKLPYMRTQDPPPPSDYVDRVDSALAYSSNGKANGGKRLYSESSYKSTPLVPEVAQELPLTSPVDDFRQPRYSSSGNLETPSKRAPTKGRSGTARRAEPDHYETDYTTGGESCDELEEDWVREYPPITSDQQRQLYKRSFDTGLQEYKSLQAELDEVNKELSRLDKELDDYREESEDYMAAADEYNRLKQVKRSADYKSKRNYCKQLKSKLSHIKKMVGDYDRRKT